MEHPRSLLEYRRAELTRVAFANLIRNGTTAETVVHVVLGALRQWADEDGQQAFARWLDELSPLDEDPQ